METAKFQTGKTYKTRSICDSNCIITAVVISRTEKTIKASIDGQPAQTFRVKEYEGQEFIKPWGTYSMAPTIRA